MATMQFEMQVRTHVRSYHNRSRVTEDVDVEDVDVEDVEFTDAEIMNQIMSDEVMELREQDIDDEQYQEHSAFTSHQFYEEMSTFYNDDDFENQKQMEQEAHESMLVEMDKAIAIDKRKTEHIRNHRAFVKMLVDEIEGAKVKKQNQMQALAEYFETIGSDKFVLGLSDDDFELELRRMAKYYKKLEKKQTVVVPVITAPKIERVKYQRKVIVDDDGFTTVQHVKIVEEKKMEKMFMACKHFHNCKHTASCEYLHINDKDQMMRCICKFNKGCKRVVSSNVIGVYDNVPDEDICRFVHYRETWESFLTRIGVPVPVPIVKPVVPVVNNVSFPSLHEIKVPVNPINPWKKITSAVFVPFVAPPPIQVEEKKVIWADPPPVTKVPIVCKHAFDGKCRFGTDCVYCHTHKEIVANCTCRHKKCFRVKKTGAVYVNVGANICKFIHQGESIESYKARMM